MRPSSRSYDQPVRVYKLIALTFLLITAILFGVILFLSSKRAVITIESDTSPVETRTTITISESPSANQIPGQIITVSTTLSQSFSPTGNKEEDGIAEGTVIFTNETNAARTLIATTRLLSPDGVLFRLKDRITVPANGTIEAAVYADEPGEASDIGPTKFTIPGLNESSQKVIYAQSEVPMQGGVRTIGVLSSSDIKVAEATLKEALVQKAQAALLASAPANTGYVFKEIESRFSSDVEIGEEVSQFTLTGVIDMAAVFYNQEAVSKQAEEMLSNRAVNDSETIEPSGKQPSVVLESIDMERGAANIEVFVDGVASLNVASDALAKETFFGMSKDEVRRHLLKLDHVRGVEVEFTPAWTLSVPSVHEHVRVIVKSVK